VISYSADPIGTHLCWTPPVLFFVEQPIVNDGVDRHQPGSIREFIDFIYPDLPALEGKCPPWPPDVFAIVASLMRRNGAYVHCITVGTDAAKPTPLLSDHWPEEAEQVGETWRNSIVQVLRERTGENGITIRRALDEVDVPADVQTAWTYLLESAEDMALDESRSALELSAVLIKLNGSVRICPIADKSHRIEKNGRTRCGQSVG
jgi:hypothetical protein